MTSLSRYPRVPVRAAETYPRGTDTQHTHRTCTGLAPDTQRSNWNTNTSLHLGCPPPSGQEVVLEECDSLQVQTMVQTLEQLMGEELVLQDTWSESLDQDFCTSTPLRLAPVSSSSLVSSSFSSSLLSVLDNGTGTASPEQVLSLWRDEGLRDGPRVLQLLDFPGDEPVSLSDLSSVLQNELCVSSNTVHQAALICFRTELQHLQSVLDQSRREKDKYRSDLEKSDFRNLQLLREMDERQVAMETSVTDRIRQVEVACRGRVSELRSQLQQEVESVQQLETEKSSLHRTLQELTTRQTHQQGELSTLTQENLSLHQDLSELRLKLKESETSFNKLQQELERFLVDKFSLEPGGGAASPERLTEIIRGYEEECRELRDRNDELTSELVKSQRKTRRPRDQRTPDNGDHDSPRVRRKLLPADRTELSSLDSGPIPSPISGLDPGQVSGLDSDPVSGLVSGLVSGPSVSLQTELALEQLRQNHQEEVQQLQVKMETQVNYYERSLEQMRRSMELERKDISQGFKMEICELEEQKSELEAQLKTMKEQAERHQQRATESRDREQSKRLQRERAEMEQNFAREISNLVQKLSAEKDQLEAELRLKMDQGQLLLRSEAERREAELRVVWENQLANQEEETQHLRSSLVQSEERLREACVQLKESATFLKSHEKLNTRLMREGAKLEVELQDKEEELQHKEAELQKARNVEEELSMDRQKLIRDLKEQAMRADQSEASLQEVTVRLNQLQLSLKEQLGQSERRLQMMTAQFHHSQTCLGKANAQLNQLQKSLLEITPHFSQSEKSLQEMSAQLGQSHELVERLQLLKSQSNSSLERRMGARLSNEGAGLTEDWAELALRLRAERDGYMRLCDQLSSQIVEMEEELQRRSADLVHQSELQRLRSESEQRLGHMEELVRRLETEDSAPYRTQVDDLRSENVALLERVSLLQQEVTSLEEEVDRKRRKTEETEQERETMKDVQERLNKENFGLRQQVLDLSNRNLELSSSNAEMSLKTRRAEEDSTTLQRLKEELVQSEREKHQLQVELSATKRQGETLSESLRSHEKEAESLRAQLQLAYQEALTIKQEVTHTQQRLKDAHNKGEELDLCLRKLITEKEEVTSSMEEELQMLQIRNQELQSKVAEVQTQDQEIHRLNQQLLELKTQVEQLERTKNQAQDQVLRADTALSVIQSQHLRQIHQIQTESKSQTETETRTRAELDSALDQLRDERERRARVEQELGEREMGERQGEQEAVSRLSLRAEDLQLQLKATRGLLQEKSSELKEQVSRFSAVSLLLQQLQLQQSELMVALQQSEQRLSVILNQNSLLQAKNQTLNQLLRRLVPEALS